MYENKEVLQKAQSGIQALHVMLLSQFICLSITFRDKTANIQLHLIGLEPNNEYNI